MNEKGRRFSEDVFRRQWNAYAATDAGKALVGFTPHDLRATKVCDERVRGKSHQQIAAMVGMSATMVMKYSRHIDQRLKPDTLFGAERRAARDKAVAEFKRLDGCRIPRKAIENPIGCISSRHRKPDQVIQPYWFGDDASKATCLWLTGLAPLRRDPAARCHGRMVEWPRGSGKMVERWGNQTDSGQNRLTPSDDRWSDRSDTYPGIAAAFASNWGAPANDLFGRAA